MAAQKNHHYSNLPPRQASAGEEKEKTRGTAISIREQSERPIGPQERSRPGMFRKKFISTHACVHGMQVVSQGN